MRDTESKTETNANSKAKDLTRALAYNAFYLKHCAKQLQHLDIATERIEDQLCDLGMETANALKIFTLDSEDYWTGLLHKIFLSVLPIYTTRFPANPDIATAKSLAHAQQAVSRLKEDAW